MYEKLSKINEKLLDLYRKANIKAYNKLISAQNKRPVQEAFIRNPLISIVVPVYNADESVLSDCVNSVKAQTYKNWELIMIDDCSPKAECVNALHKYDNEPQIITGYHKKNCQISKTTNDCIALAHGEYIAFMDCDDFIEPDALYYMVEKAIEDNADMVYTDEDHVSADGKIFSYPTFKPDWSYDTLLSLMYTGHFSMYRKSIIDVIGGLGVGVDGSQDYDLTLRFVEKAKKISHVPYVMYHWREGENSTSGNPEAKAYAYKAAYEAKKRTIVRNGHNAVLDYIPEYYQTRVTFLPDKNETISLVLIGGNENDCIRLKKNIDNQLENSSSINVYCENREIDTVSYATVLNRIFDEASEDVIIVINRSEVLFTDDDVAWINILAGSACQTHVGMSVPLIKCREIVSEAGIDYNNSLKTFGRIDNGVRSPRTMRIMPVDVLAGGPDVFAMRKDVFKKYGEFDTKLTSYGTLIDYSLRLHEDGKYCVLRPDAVFNKMKKGNAYAVTKDEAAIMLNRYTDFDYDPYYSNNYCDFRHNLSISFAERMYIVFLKLDTARLNIFKRERYNKIW